MNLLRTIFSLTLSVLLVFGAERMCLAAATTKHRPELNTFGQFIGTWTFSLKNYLPDGGVQHRVGRWTFRWALDGKAVQDFWCMAPERQTPRLHCVGEGTTVRIFDVRTGHWKVVWIAPESATIEVFTAQQEESKIVLRGSDVNGIQDRWTFFNIRKEAFDWKAESSNDGTTWQLRQEMSVVAKSKSRNRARQ